MFFVILATDDIDQKIQWINFVRMGLSMRRGTYVSPSIDTNTYQNDNIYDDTNNNDPNENLNTQTDNIVTSNDTNDTNDRN